MRSAPLPSIMALPASGPCRVRVLPPSREDVNHGDRDERDRDEDDALAERVADDRPPAVDARLIVRRRMPDAGRYFLRLQDERAAARTRGARRYVEHHDLAVPRRRQLAHRAARLDIDVQALDG